MKYDSKPALVAAIESEYGTLCERLDAIPARRCREVGVWGDGWNIVDLVAHLVEWQRMFLTWYADGEAGRKPQIPAPGYKWSQTPELNRAIREKHKSRSLKDVRAELDAGHKQLSALAASLPEKRLVQPKQYAWTGSSTMATYLSGCTASHYRFASNVIKRWQKAETRTNKKSGPR